MRKESNPLSSMLLEPERPEHSSHPVRSRPMGTDQLRLLNTLHGKATGTQKRELRPKASLSRRDLVEVLTLYDVHGFGFAGFVSVLTVHLTFRCFCFFTPLFSTDKGDKQRGSSSRLGLPPVVLFSCSNGVKLSLGRFALRVQTRLLPPPPPACKDKITAVVARHRHKRWWSSGARDRSDDDDDAGEQ